MKIIMQEANLLVLRVLAADFAQRVGTERGGQICASFGCALARYNAVQRLVIFDSVEEIQQLLLE